MKQQTPPNSKESEMMVLGNMLTSNEGLNIAADSLYEADFYHLEHKTIFNALKRIMKEGKPADIHLVSEDLKVQGSLESIGGIKYLMDLAQYAGTSAYIEEYVKEIQKYSKHRKQAEISRLITEKSLNGEDCSQLILNLQEISENNQKDKISIKSCLQISKDYFLTKPPEKKHILHIVDVNGKKTPFLHQGITGMLVAEGGLGKTKLLSLMAGSIATGIPFLKQYIVSDPGAVCLIMGENDGDDIHRCLYDVRENLQEKLKANQKTDSFGEYRSEFMLHYDDPLSVLEGNIFPISVHGVDARFIDKEGERTPFYRNILRELQDNEPKNGWKVIILDPASRFAGTEAEKDNGVATAFIAALENITKQLKGNPLVLFAHHKNKASIGLDTSSTKHGASQSSARGVSGFTDGVRWQATLTRHATNEGEEVSRNSEVIFEITKTNFTTFQPAILLKKNQYGIAEFDSFHKNVKPSQKKSEENKTPDKKIGMEKIKI